ncbi:hypothetical protein HKD37_07G018414 [Glycine soja]
MLQRQPSRCKQRCRHRVIVWRRIETDTVALKVMLCGVHSGIMAITIVNFIYKVCEYKKSCVVTVAYPSEKEPYIDDMNHHGLYFEDEHCTRMVTLAKIYEGSLTIHHIILINDVVSVSKVLNDDASISFPTSKDLHRPPKKSIVELVDKSMSIDDPLVDLIKLYQVAWDATLFGAMNDFSIEFGHGFVYGFFESQSIHNANDRRDECQGYITRWLNQSQIEIYQGTYVNKKVNKDIKSIVNNALKEFHGKSLKNKSDVDWIELKLI